MSVRENILSKVEFEETSDKIKENNIPFGKSQKTHRSTEESEISKDYISRGKVVRKIKGKILEVNLGYILDNLFFLRSKKEKDALIFPVLKSSAYGHGITHVAQAIDEHVDGFCVGLVEEAERLRKVSERPIVLLKGTFSDEETEFCREKGIWITVRDEFDLRDKLRRDAPIFIKVDTGMGRLGVLPDKIDEIISLVKSTGKAYLVKGVISHFAFSDFQDTEFIREQIRVFEKVSRKLERALGKKLIKTLSNSAGTLTEKRAHFDLVRPGIALYGITPFFEDMRFSQKLKPALSVRTEVLSVKDIPKGWSVGYSRKFIAQKNVKIAVLNIGYSDGVPRLWWKSGYVIIKGRRAKIVGLISMDMMAAVCPSDEKIVPGDIATVLGKDGDETISAYEIAEKTGTIPYEVLCSIGFSET